MVRFLYDVELEYTSSNEEDYGYSSKPPCEGNACREAGDHEKKAAYCVANDG